MVDEPREDVATPEDVPAPEDVAAPTEAEKGAELDSLRNERDEYLQLAQRTKADFENYRKRVARESAEPIDRDAAPNHLVHGVRLVYEELTGVLRGAGIESYEPVGEAFDPDWHEAMMTRPGEDGQVLEVLQKGYRLDGQVLRPARVVVGAEQKPSAGKPADGLQTG